MITLIQALLALVCALAPVYIYPQGSSHILHIGLTLTAGFASMFIGKRIPLKSSIFPLIQVLAIQAILQWLAENYFAVQPMPLLTVAIILIGYKCGAELRKYLEVKSALEMSLVVDKIKSQTLSLTQLSLVKQEEADRRILAGDLHDQVLNDLKIVRAKLNRLDSNSNNNNLTAVVAELDSLLEASSNQIRQVMESLFPSVLENLGLVSALEDLLKQYGSKGKFRSRLECTGDLASCQLEAIDDLLIFRIVQEALNNVVKHSAATQVILRINVSADRQLTICVSDNGKGMETKDLDISPSRGLRYVRQRADLIGAQVNWQSEAAGNTDEPADKSPGTTFTFILPPKSEV